MIRLQCDALCSCQRILHVPGSFLQQLSVQRRSSPARQQQQDRRRQAQQQHVTHGSRPTAAAAAAAAAAGLKAAAAGSKAVLACVTIAVLWVFQMQVLAAPVGAAELVGSSSQSEGNVPSELSAAGEQQAFPLSSLMQGSDKKQIEGCTRRCVPTCIRGGEGSPGLGPISMRREIVVFKDGFRSRQYCLSECAQTCKLMSDNEKQQQQQQQKGPQ